MESAHVSPADGILLIGDNRFLLRLVATNLAPWSAAAVLLGPDAMPFEQDALRLQPSCKLILLALSRSNNEPIVILARTGLTQLVGSIPLLIISDRIFAADPERQIFHLSFPFSAAALQQQVNELLSPPVASFLNESAKQGSAS